MLNHKIRLKNFTGEVQINAIGGILEIALESSTIKKTTRKKENPPIEKTKKGFEFATLPGGSDELHYLPRRISRSLTGSNGKNGLPLGVSVRSATGKYIAACNNEMGERIQLGSFDTPNDASMAYRGFKTNVIHKLADMHRQDISVDAYESLKSLVL